MDTGRLLPPVIFEASASFLQTCPAATLLSEKPLYLFIELLIGPERTEH